MLTSRIQRPHKLPASDSDFTDKEFAAMTPAARNLATQAWLDRTQGLKPGATQNRDFRETCGQGPSFDLLSSNSRTDADDFDPRDHDPEPDTRRRAGEGEDTEEGELSEETDELIAIDTPSGDLWFAVANPFCTDTKRSRGGPARLLDKNAWNAILALYPLDGPDRDVLVASAQCGALASKQIGMMVGLSEKRVRGIQDQKLQSALKNLTAADLRAHRDDPITTEAVVRRPPSRAGRKRAGAPPRAPRFLVLAPHTPAPLRPRRPYRPRVRRPRWVEPGQLDCFEEAA